MYLDCIYNDHTLMLLDAEIYVTVYIISSLVPRPPPFLPFNCIHKSGRPAKNLPCIIVNANRRPGNEVTSFSGSSPGFGTHTSLVSDPKPTPVWITFSILGTRLAFSPTLSLH